jgi:riboflavin biosynthesis pyrimidine reductase
MGSAAVQQALRAGLLDLLALHVVPILLGGGVRLLDDLGELPGGGELELERVIDAPGVTHLLYRVAR